MSAENDQLETLAERAEQSARKQEQLVQVAQLRLFIICGNLTVPVYLAYAIHKGLLYAGILAFVCMLLYAFTWLSFSYFKKVRMSAWMYIASCQTSVFFAQLADGQSHSAVLWLAVIPPVVAAYLMGVKDALIAASTAALIIVGSVALEEFVQLEPSFPQDSYTVLMGRLTCLFFVCGFAVLFRLSSDKRIRKLSEQQADLEAARLSAEQAQAQSEAANRAKNQFLANMSHEIRTPMNGVLGMVELLRSKDVEEQDQQKAVDTIQKCAGHLLELLNGILDVTKIQSGQLELSSSRFQLHAVVQEVYRVFEVEAQAKKLELAFELPEEDAVLCGDRTRVKQIVANLLGNAVKFSDSGRILVRCTTQDAPDNPYRCEVMISVQDEGIGMSPNQRTRLFSQFEQVHTDDQVHRGGTGLGLAMCAQLIQLMGGRIEVESELHKGSTFRVHLPFERAQQVDLTTTFPPEMQETEQRAPGEPVLVLVVDDNEINLRVATLYLEKLGCKVETAFDGQNAVEKCQSTRYDLIFMDMRMPRKNGVEATISIRAVAGPCQHTPIIALTANAYDEDREQCIQAGMQDHLAKPATLRALKSMIERFVVTLDEPAANQAPQRSISA